MHPDRNDTQPEGPRVSTDPGMGVTVKERTDPGVAPPVSLSRALEVVTEESAPPVGGASDDVATQPAAAVPVRVLPRAERVPEPTPVPPEADGLLNGLIASENEAYFRKAKASAQSSGEAAAAFHGQPHAVAPGNPTPPPEAPVLLRRSVELEVADAEALAKAQSERKRSDRDTDPAGRSGPVPELLPEPTVPLPEPGSPWTDRAIAFGLALLAVGALGIAAVRWLGHRAPPEETSFTSHSEGSPASTAQPAVTAAPPPPVAPESTVSIPPPPPVADPTSTAAEPVSADPVQRPTRAPRAPAAPRKASAPGASSAPGEAPPTPKDDVKRSM
jgi:hypothetical protein